MRQTLLTKGSASTPAISLFGLGLVAALLPLITIHLCFAFSIWQGYLELCNPYWVSCHSISATGRHGIAYFVFKGGMISAMLLLAIFWIINAYWLKYLGIGSGRVLLWLGPIASIALIVYTLSLGHSGGAFYILRRTGVVTYLGLTFIAQGIFSAALAKCHQPQISLCGRRLLRYCGCMLFIAIFTLVLDAAPMIHYEPLEDMVEWMLVLLLNIHALSVVFLWRSCGLAFSLKTNPPR